MQKVEINKIQVHAFVSSNELIDYALSNPSILVAINAEKIQHASESTRHIINGNIGYCDGIGAVWAVNMKLNIKAAKIAGCELWLKLIERLRTTSSFYFVGSRQEVIEATVEKLKNIYPDLNIVGWRNGYISSDAERENLINDIILTKPDVVFVAMGSPKQELLMAEMQKHHKAIYQGLGGSFDVFVGSVKRAPKWWIDHNLEFAYRLIKQPKRIFRQLHLLSFALNVLLNKF